jgi:type VI secretion system protein ImpL
VWLFVAFALILLLVIGVLVWLVWLNRQTSRQIKMLEAPPGAEEEAKKGEVPAPPPITAAELRRSFRRGLAAYRQFATGWRHRYLVPWYVVVGETSSGKTTLLSGLERTRNFRVDDDTAVDQAGGCGWWFFDQAVVLDVAGQVFLSSDGTATGGGLWRRVLGLLQESRPRRPIDGIVLTIPADQLSDPSEGASGRLQAKARQLCTRLWEAQRVFGLRLPVYLVITKCDTISGFQAFARALPRAGRENMLGWSNPYALDAAWRGEWVDEAFESIGDALFHREMELFAARNEGSKDEDVFLFPVRLPDLKDPLRACLNTIFRGTAFQEGLHLRGIYMVGDGGADLQPGASAREVVPVFAGDLFRRKIFPERDVARAFGWRSGFVNPRQVLAQTVVVAIALLGALGIGMAGARLAHLRDGFVPSLATLAQGIRTLPAGAAARSDGQTARTPIDPAVAQSVVSAYTRINESWPTALAPISWVSGLEERTVTALAIGYYKVLSNGIRNRLEYQGALLADAPTAGVTVPRDLPPELARLKAAVIQILAFERGARLFGAINGTAELTGLDTLYEYAFDTTLPPEFADRAQAYGFTAAPDNRALRGVSLDGELRPFDLAPYQASAISRVEELADVYFVRLSSGSDAALRLAKVAEDLNLLVGGRRRDSAEPILKSIQVGLREAGNLLGSQDASWIGMSNLMFGAEMQQILNAVGSSQLLGPAVRNEIVAHARTQFSRVQLQGQPINSVIGPLMVRNDQDLHATLSPAAQSLRDALDRLMSRSFIRGAAGARLDPGAAGRAIVWDTHTLEGAVGLAEDYLLFEASDANQFPKPLQAAIRGLARQQLASSMMALVARAQTPFSGESALVRSRVENDLRLQVRSFRAAYPLLLQILQTLDQFSQTRAYDALFEVATGQAAELLTQVDRLLLADQPYTVRGGDFSWWNGDRLSGTEAFGQRSPADLDAFLHGTRSHIALLARELAEPLVEFMYRPEVRRSGDYLPLTAKWANILVQLDRYDTAKPSSSVNSLEHFITVDMGEVELATCMSKLPLTDEPIDDYFMQRLDDLRQQMRLRCRQLVDERFATDYNLIARAFDDLLAGNFPFTPETVTDGRQPVRVENIQEFFKVFDPRADSLIEGFAARAKFSRGGGETLRFLTDLRAVREFLRPLLSDEANRSYTLEIDFRANRRDEIGGHEIMDWRMASGDSQVNQLQAKPQLRWRIGDPVTLVLRWAKDSTDIPIALENPGDGGLDERTGRFFYRGPWSLLSFIAQHRTRPVDPTRFAPREVLVFNARTRVAATASDAPTQTARVFVGITVKQVVVTDGKVTKEERLLLPHFPSVAPRMPGIGSPVASAPEPAKNSQWGGRPGRLSGEPATGASPSGATGGDGRPITIWSERTMHPEDTTEPPDYLRGAR